MKGLYSQKKDSKFDADLVLCVEDGLSLIHISGDSLIEVDAGILALHEENPDCIGWLTIDGTRIDYPVMYLSLIHISAII